MAKLRLYISDRYPIVMKKIIRVVIDGVELNRNDYKTKESRVLVGFYNFLRRNKDKISYICYKEHEDEECLIHLYLKDCKLHNENGQAYLKLTGDLNIDFYDYYYLNGEHLEYAIWKKRVRKIKLLKFI